LDIYADGRRMTGFVKYEKNIDFGPLTLFFLLKVIIIKRLFLVNDI